ncbi:MAG: MCE family protein [Nocardioides sp.]|uniref:MCE family protein n=1 Tax=Nocardioides sp. TaxID=35761 RepID=UPI0039E2B7BE
MLVLTLGLSGCSFDAYSLPLPGGADTGDDPITVTVQFADVLDLVPDSSVKVGDVTVGRVQDIALDDGHADVRVQLRKDTKLPVNAVATIRQTSLLGEKFVDLAAPETDPSTTMLASGDTITLANSGRNPEIEEVLGALSLVLNGGGVAQLQTISTELNKALAGHEDAARDVLTQVNQLVTQLDDHKADIVNAIEAVDRLAKSARSQEDTIDATLEELPGALTSIESQRKDLVTMLQALSDLGEVGTRVIKASKAQVIRTFDNLEPTLTQLANAGDHLVNSLDTAFTYPFVDEVVGRDPTVAKNLHMGDYVNLSITLQVDASDLLDASSAVPSVLNPTNVVSNLTKCLTSGDLSSQACKDLLAAGTTVLDIINACKKPSNRDTALCKLINQVPGLPTAGVTIIPSDLASQLASAIPGVGDVLGGALAGLSRAPVGADGRSKVTYEQLSEVYDPSLVRLLVPGLAVKETVQ